MGINRRQFLQGAAVGGLGFLGTSQPAYAQSAGLRSLTYPIRLTIRSDNSNGRSAQVEIELPQRFDRPIEMTIQGINRSNGAIAVSPSRITVPANTNRFKLTVQALRAGDEIGRPAALLRVSSADTNAIEIPVYVEPTEGRWRFGSDLGMVGVHAALMPNGRAIFFSPPRKRKRDGTFEQQPNGEFSWGNPLISSIDGINNIRDIEIAVLEPNGSVSPSLMEPGTPKRNLFCAGQTHLPNGKLFIAGGHSIEYNGIALGEQADRHLHTFDATLPSGKAWSRVGEMIESRWYPTVTTLPDGRMLIVAGSRGGPLASGLGQVNINGTWVANKNYDIFDPARGILRLESGGQRPIFLADDDFANYPFLCSLPSGSAFPNGVVLCQERRFTHIYPYNPNAQLPLGQGPTATLTTLSRGSRTYPFYGSCVVLPISAAAPERTRILILGGQSETDSNLRNTRAFATNTAEILDFDSNRPANRQSGWRKIASMNVRRFLCDGTLLPDGNVLVTGGATQGFVNGNSGPVLLTELFDSQTETFRAMMPARIERRYHSTALLMPDGTVLKAGSTGGFPPSGAIVPQYGTEIFLPPYLFRGARPIVNSVGQIQYRGTFTVKAAAQEGANIAKVVLVKLSAVTHGVNMGQRHIFLEFSNAGNDTLQVKSPRDGTIAPPGPYMLFVLDDVGVPSVGRFVIIR
jgi:hypothetical protein